MELENIKIRKLLRSESTEKIGKIIRLALLVISISLLVWIILGMIQNYLSTKSIISTLDTEIKSKINKSNNIKIEQDILRSQDYKLIAEKNIFGELGIIEEENTDDQETVSDLPLELVGTYNDGSFQYAIIREKEKRKEDVFNLGETIFDTATLESVEPLQVTIKRGGELEILKLDDSSLSGESSGSEYSDIENVENIDVKESELDKALENLPLLLTQARAVPYFKDGKSIGLRLFAIKRNSLFEKIGLKNGDILKSINKNSLADITQAIKLFERLKQEKKIELLMERSRKERVIKYRIK